MSRKRAGVITDSQTVCVNIPSALWPESCTRSEESPRLLEEQLQFVHVHISTFKTFALKIIETNRCHLYEKRAPLPLRGITGSEESRHIIHILHILIITRSTVIQLIVVMGTSGLIVNIILPDYITQSMMGSVVPKHKTF